MFRREVKMRGILLVVAAVALVATPAMAQSNNATFSVLPMGPTDVTAGTPVGWMVKVDVSGPNQGLAAWALDLEVRNSSNALIPNNLTHELSPSFSIGGAADPSGVPFKAGFTLGGPNASITADPAKSPGKLEGFGGGYAPPWTYTPKADRKTGGIGRADQAATLLMNPANGFILHQGTIDTTGLPNGTYTVTLKTAGTPVVIAGDANLLTNLVGSFTTPLIAGEWNPTSTFTFTIPEPATLLLIAGAGLLIRRRRTA